MKIIHFYHFDSDPRFPEFFLYFWWKSGVTFVRRCFRDENEALLSKPKKPHKQSPVEKSTLSFLIGANNPLNLTFEPRCEKTGLRGVRPGPTQTGLYSYRRWLEARNFVFRKWRDCTISVAKTKSLISFAVTVKLICVFVFAYAKSRFSHDEAHLYMKTTISNATKTTPRDMR